MLDQNHKIALDISRVRGLAKALDQIGTPVPEELTDALEFAKIGYDTESATAAATASLRQAQTKDEVDAALADLAASASVWANRELISGALRTEQHGRLMSAVRDREDEIFGHLADGFQPLADAFWVACQSLPDVAAPGTGEWRRTEAESNAIRETQRLKAEMDKLWLPYRNMAELLGYVSSTVETVYSLAEVVHDQNALNCAHMLDNVNVIKNLNAWKPLFPFYPVVTTVGKLRLSATPRDIRDLRESVSGRSAVTAPGSGISIEPMMSN